MIFCEHIENKNVKIVNEKSDGLFSKPSEHFVLYLLKHGSLAFELNGIRCFLNGNAVICVSGNDKIKMLY